MVDHPLVADNMRRYIQHNRIEESLNDGLNLVLATLPQDPFSQLAAALIDVSHKTKLIHPILIFTLCRKFKDLPCLRSLWRQKRF